MELYDRSSTFSIAPTIFAYDCTSCRAAERNLVPPEIQIILIHNYDKISLAEKSLKYLGINNYTLLRPKIDGPWRHSAKLVTLKKFLESKKHGFKYILYLDSADVILRDDPRNVLTYFQEQNCDLLFSRTAFDVGYECMEEIKAWTEDVAKKMAVRFLFEFRCLSSVKRLFGRNSGEGINITIMI
jgi:hypothetical protein